MLLASQRFGAKGMLDHDGVFSQFHLRVALHMADDAVQALTEFGRRGKALIQTRDSLREWNHPACCGRLLQLRRLPQC